MRHRRLALLLSCCFACRTATPPPAEKQTEQTVRQMPDPPGRRVSIGAKSLYIECAGQGSPTVVFEAGLGGGAGVWEGSILDVRRHTRACRYERLGIQRSDPAPRPHSPVDMAIELSELLAASNEAPPFVMVGHSLGGINVRLFAQNDPRAVVGLVLVDAMHEDQERRVEALEPEGVRRQMRDQLAAGSEGLSAESLSEALEALRRGERSLGSRPLVVVSAGLPQRALPGESEEVNRKVWATHRALQAELVQLSSNSVQVIAEHSGHAIPLDQPQLIIDATLVVVEAVRTGERVQREQVLGPDEH